MAQACHSSLVGVDPSFYPLQGKTRAKVAEMERQQQTFAVRRSQLLYPRFFTELRKVPGYWSATQIAAQMSLVSLPVPLWLDVTNEPVPVFGSYTNVTSSIPASTTAPSGVTIMNSPEYTW